MDKYNPEEPPAFFLTETDRQVLAQTDEEFIYHDWEDLKEIIARNDLGILKRKPSDLLRYLKWSKDTKAQYGSIINYICQCRLGWPLPGDNHSSSSASSVTTTTTGSSGGGGATSPTRGPGLSFNNPIPFADPSDYKILRNDWPYGLAAGISHLVVWLRTPIAVKDESGEITEESGALIEKFMQKTFVARLAREEQLFPDPNNHVLWFKNFTALQSVRGLEHVHVLLKEVPDYLIKEWTGE